MSTKNSSFSNLQKDIRQLMRLSTYIARDSVKLIWSLTGNILNRGQKTLHEVEQRGEEEMKKHLPALKKSNASRSKKMHSVSHTSSGRILEEVV